MGVGTGVRGASRVGSAAGVGDVVRATVGVGVGGGVGVGVGSGTTGRGVPGVGRTGDGTLVRAGLDPGMSVPGASAVGGSVGDGPVGIQLLRPAASSATAAPMRSAGTSRSTSDTSLDMGRRC